MSCLTTNMWNRCLSKRLDFSAGSPSEQSQVMDPAHRSNLRHEELPAVSVVILGLCTASSAPQHGEVSAQRSVAMGVWLLSRGGQGVVTT